MCMYDYLWISMTIYDYIRLCLTIFETVILKVFHVFENFFKLSKILTFSHDSNVLKLFILFNKPWHCLPSFYLCLSMFTFVYLCLLYLFKWRIYAQILCLLYWYTYNINIFKCKKTIKVSSEIRIYWDFQNCPINQRFDNLCT